MSQKQWGQQCDIFKMWKEKKSIKMAKKKKNKKKRKRDQTCGYQRPGLEVGIGGLNLQTCRKKRKRKKKET